MRCAIFLSVIALIWWIIDETLHGGLSSGAVLFFLVLASPLAASNTAWTLITLGLYGSHRNR